METDSTLAIPKSGHLAVWTSTQDTCGSKRALVSLLNVDESTVTVSNTQTGGGYGGKHWKVIRTGFALAMISADSCISTIM
jgi:xanthine dehydrogenase molybdopterin-binding subunit B